MTHWCLQYGRTVNKLWPFASDSFTVPGTNVEKTDDGQKLFTPGHFDLIIVDDDHPGPYLAIGEVVNMDEHGGTLVNYSPDKKAVRGTIDPETVKAWKPLEVPEEFNSEFLYVLVIYDENGKYVESSICSTMVNAKKKGIDMTHAYPGWTYRIITEKL